MYSSKSQPVPNRVLLRLINLLIIIFFPYRKKALSCHPDKNPNDEQAGDTFHQLTEALTILTNPKSRKSYDSLLKSRKSAGKNSRQKIKIVRTQERKHKTETYDDEGNEIYDPDFENVKVDQRIKPKRYISIGKHRKPQKMYSGLKMEK